MISCTNKLAPKTEKLTATQQSRNSLPFLEPGGSISSMLNKTQKVNSFSSRKEYLYSKCKYVKVTYLVTVAMVMFQQIPHHPFHLVPPP
jgi:hypothetical protein